MAPRLERASVIGSGAMGSMCAILLAGRGTRVTLWARSAGRANDLRTTRENRRYLPGHAFPSGVSITDDAGTAFADPELVVSAVPCQYVRGVWSRLAGCVAGTPPPVVSVTKGIEVETLLRPTQVLREIIDGVSLAALSGPCLAPEAAAGLPTAVVVASDDHHLADLVQAAFSTDTFRVYTNTDLSGVEFAGAAKNVIAIAAGACDGLGLGNNAKASLLTRGLVEITRLGMSLGASADTFRGLAGIGDLIATCNSVVSRNHTAGVRIGRGESVEEVIRTANGVVEGIETTRSMLQLAERNLVEMPITRAVYRVLFENQSPRTAINSLMTRKLKGE